MPGLVGVGGSLSGPLSARLAFLLLLLVDDVIPGVDGCLTDEVEGRGDNGRGVGGPGVAAALLLGLKDGENVFLHGAAGVIRREDHLFGSLDDLARLLLHDRELLLDDLEGLVAYAVDSFHVGGDE